MNILHTLIIEMHALSILGVILSLIALAYSVTRLVRKLKTEKKFIHCLANAEEFRALIEQEEFAKRLTQGDVTLEDLDPAKKVVEMELQFLDKKERKYIREALYQPTVRGREEYLKKLILKAMPKEWS